MFYPQQIIFEKDALTFPLGQTLYQSLGEKGDVPIQLVASNRIGSAIPGNDLSEKYQTGKRTLVIGVKKSLKFQSCKPSAHYQLPLVSGCMGQCEYCYLNTQLGDKPYVRVHVNIDQILEQAVKYTKERLPEITIFEGSATSDPVPVEPYTHSLAQCITFMAQEEHMRFRFVTKYTDVDEFLSLDHNNHTEIRFSINTERVISDYEHFTPKARHRIQAAVKVMEAGYPTGFLIAPVFAYPGWKEEYRELITELANSIKGKARHPVTFEVISHRYTLRAKERILTVFPESTLPMTEEDRKFQYGQFGYGKYKYPKEQLAEFSDFFMKELKEKLPEAEIKYII